MKMFISFTMYLQNQIRPMIQNVKKKITHLQEALCIEISYFKRAVCGGRSHLVLAIFWRVCLISNPLTSMCVCSYSSKFLSAGVFTVDGSAIAGSDYTSLDQSYTLPGNQPSRTIPITILNDGNVENNEQFTARLESSNAQVTEALATITIDDNDGRYSVSCSCKIYFRVRVIYISIT